MFKATFNILRFFLSTRTASYGFFSHCNRFKIMSPLSFHLSQIFAIHCRLFETWIFSVTTKFRKPVLQSLNLRQSHFKAWFSCNHEISILHKMTSYGTIWRPLLSHTNCLFQVSYVCDFIWAPYFISSCQEKSLQLLMKSCYETCSTDSNNWISFPFISL